MFLFGNKKVKGLKFLEGATDIHCHLLAGVDDGFHSLSESYELLDQYQQAGVKRVYFTPHSMGLEGAVADEENNHRRHHHHHHEDPNQAPTPGQLYRESALASPYASEPLGGYCNEHLQERFEEYKKHYKGSVEIRLAAEYMMNKEFPAKFQEKKLLTYADGVHVLVETSYFAPPAEMDDILYSLAVNGYKPILAHPERYRYMTREDYRNLKSRGYEFQLNFLALTGYYGDDVFERASDLLDAGMYDFTGSDFHRLSTFYHLMPHIKMNSKRTDKLLKLFENNGTI